MSCQTNGQTNGPCPNWTYDPNLTNRISTAGFTYDAAGNLTADGTHSYQWDGEGRLVTVDNGATIVLVHNALGQQVGVTGGGGTDINWQLRSPAGKPQGNYSIAYVGWNLGFFFLDDKLVGADTGNWEGMVFLHQNNLNSVTAPTIYDGSQLDDTLLYPWGQYWEGEGWTFAGMDHFWADFLHTTPNRQYAFYEGRWLSPDPLGGDVTNPQSLNRYAYVLNNPTSFSDPLGLVKVPPGTGGGGGCGCVQWGWVEEEGGPGHIECVKFANCGPPPPEGPPAPPDPAGGGGGGRGRRGKQQIIKTQLDDLLANLIADAECMAWLRSKKRDPIVEATLAKFTPVNDMPPAYDAWVYGGNVEISSTGLFFSNLRDSSGNTILAGRFPGGTSQAQQLILLHETAHLTDVIVPERGSMVQTDANDFEILKHCQKALGIK